MSGQSNTLNPTFDGHIASTLDALILFEACLSGHLNHVPRRPHDRERQDLIKSGNVFIYEEHASGIKRWTDGVSWSPSRILGNFLIYRELEKPFPPGEKKRALKRKKCPSGGIGKPELGSRSSMSSFPLPGMDSVGKDTERALIGSLIDSYPFKKDGLIKKTISVTYQGIPHHLVSYYNVNDVVSGCLATPSRHPSTRNIIPRAELVSQNFRAPIDEVEYIPDERCGHPALYTMSNAHGFGNGSSNALQRAMTLPSFQPLSVSSAYGTTPYGYTPQQHYMASTSPMPPPMSQQVSPSMSLPHMHHSTPSLNPSPVSSNTSHMSYASHQQGNYSLDPHRTARFSSDSSLVHEFPRNMPTYNSSRRVSNFEASQPSDLSSISLGSVTDGQHSSNGNAYMRQSSYYFPSQIVPVASPENHAFAHTRPIKAETEIPSVDSGPQHYGLDENNPAWGFEGIDNSQGQQYYGNQTDENPPTWHGGPNGVGRS